IDAADDFGAIFRQGLLLGTLEVKWQATSVLNPAAQPETRFDLINPAGEQRIALVLGIGKVSGRPADRRLRVGADKQSPGNRKPSVADHIRVTGEAGKLVPLGNGYLSFCPVN